MPRTFRMVAEVLDGDQWKVVEAPVDFGQRRAWSTTNSSSAFAILCNGPSVSLTMGPEADRRGGEYEIISPLKGWPGEMSSQLRKLHDNLTEADGGGHPYAESWAHTWYLLSELMAFDWSKKVKMREFLCPAEYIRLDAGDIIAEPTGELSRYVEAVGREKAGERKFGQSGCPVERIDYWSTYADEAVNLVRFDLPKLLALGDPDKVRITVWVEP